MSAQGTVLIVEDKSPLLQKYVSYLAEAGFAVQGVLRGLEALEVLDTFVPDIILIDVELPDIDGRLLCGKIRKRPGYSTKNTKYIVMMSSKFKSSLDVTIGYEQGADFYQTGKPDTKEELVSMVRALMHKLGPSNEDGVWEDREWLVIDKWVAINSHHAEIRVGSQVKKISRAQYHILRYLYKNFDTPCSEADLCEIAYIDGSTLEKDMSNLRTIIKDLLGMCSPELSIWSYLPRKSDRGYALRKPSKQST